MRLSVIVIDEILAFGGALRLPIRRRTIFEFQSRLASPVAE
jgi:hypothetical protein